jgi:hypothetical protein
VLERPIVDELYGDRVGLRDAHYDSKMNKGG